MPLDSRYILRELQEHPRVCSNCFRLRHNEDPVPPRILENRLRSGVRDAMWTRTKHADTESPPGETVSEIAQRTVCECGEFSPNGQIFRDHGAPLDGPTVCEFGRYLNETLAELETEYRDRGHIRRANRFAHDEDVLFSVLKYLKRDPDRQFKDNHIFAAAVELACEREPRPNGSRSPASDD